MNQNEGEPTPTIVGGQPVGKHGGQTGLPHGIEAIVLLAAAEPSFRKDFARDRKAALQRAGIRLSQAEQAILDTVRDRQLFAMAERAAATPKAGKRGVLATAVSLAALASLTTGPRPSKADSPDSPASRPALGQLDARAEAAGEPGLSAAGDITPTPTETPPPIDGIRPDTPTPTFPPVVGILTETPTPTETPVPPTATSMPTPSVSPVGIWPDTPTPTETPEISPVGIWPDTPTPTETPSSTETPNADLDGDGKVDHQDLMLFMKQWYATRGEEPASETDQ